MLVDEYKERFSHLSGLEINQDVHHKVEKYM